MLYLELEEENYKDPTIRFLLDLVVESDRRQATPAHGWLEEKEGRRHAECRDKLQIGWTSDGIR